MKSHHVTVHRRHRRPSHRHHPGECVLQAATFLPLLSMAGNSLSQKPFPLAATGLSSV